MQRALQTAMESTWQHDSAVRSQHACKLNKRQHESAMRAQNEAYLLTLPTSLLPPTPAKSPMTRRSMNGSRPTKLHRHAIAAGSAHRTYNATDAPSIAAGNGVNAKQCATAQKPASDSIG